MLQRFTSGSPSFQHKPSALVQPEDFDCFLFSFFCGYYPKSAFCLYHRFEHARIFRNKLLRRIFWISWQPSAVILGRASLYCSWFHAHRHELQLCKSALNIASGLLHLAYFYSKAAKERNEDAAVFRKEQRARSSVWRPRNGLGHDACNRINVGAVVPTVEPAAPGVRRGIQ